MQRKEYEITINSSKEKVWNVLWKDNTYPLWSAPFCKGSRAETDWNEGSRVKFLGPTGDGMLSRIKVSDPYEKMHFEHLGIVENGKEDTQSEKAKKWIGVIEQYELTESNGIVKVTVANDIPEDYLDYFGKAWPAALQKVKELSEN